MTVQNYTSKDGKTYKIKVVIITEKKASHNQRTSIRKTTGNFISKIISGFPSNKVVDELVFGTIPNKLYSELKQIVPVKRIELVKSKLVNA